MTGALFEGLCRGNLEVTHKAGPGFKSRWTSLQLILTGVQWGIREYIIQA